MISTLTGRVSHIGLDALVLEVGGVGYLVRTTTQALAATGHDAELTLHTELVVREDSLTLYGFPQPAEAEVFRTVQAVSGIGPRIALAVLTVLGPDGLRRAVAEQDAKAIARTPGIGPKVAQRMLLELGGKLAAPDGSAPAPAGDGTSPAGDGTAPAGGAPAPGPRQDVVEALVGLGWPEKAADKAVHTATQAAGEEGSPDSAALLRSALRELGGTR